MLGVQENTNGKIIVFSQFRDAMNEVDGERIFRSLQHRYELIQAILESLEELEDQAEMEEEDTFYEDLDQEEGSKDGEESKKEGDENDEAPKKEKGIFTND